MQPLEEIRVMDMTRFAPGPFCTWILADWGAEVIKIEEPGGSRRAREERAAQGAPSPEEERRNAAFDVLSRNKKSLALNLRAEEARKIFYELAERSDVVLEGFRPGVVKRLGVDYETISKINPRIIYCSISGYGQDGPYAGLVGHDINYISIAGALGIIGTPEGKPVIPYNILGDYAGGGMHAAIGILLAVIARQKTGRGQYIDVSMTDGVVALLAPVFAEYFTRGSVARPSQTRFNGGVPYYAVYQCQDGKYISVGCNEPWFWENLCKALGREDFVPHQYTEGAKRQEIFKAFEETFKTRSRDEWFDYLFPREVAVSKVYSVDEAVNDPQVQQRGLMKEINDPLVGKVRQVGTFLRMSESEAKIRSLGPTIGQHTDEILGSLGYTSDHIASLRTAGAVG